MSTQSETVTIRMPSEAKARLEELARHTRRSKSFLAGEAIADYVERELAIIEGITRGLADMEARRVTSHADAMARMRKTVADASRK